MDLERLIREHKDAVYRQMVRVCGNQDDAEDALADAIFSALKASDQLRDPAALRGWLASIGRRACARSRIRDRLLKGYRLSELFDKGIEIPDSCDPELEAEAEILRGCVHRALDSLAPIYRDAYELRDVQGLSSEASADRLGITVQALKSRLHRARVMLRESLDHGFGCAGFELAG